MSTACLQSVWRPCRAQLALMHICCRSDLMPRVIHCCWTDLTAILKLFAQASATWDKFRKERDFHRMHHKRVAQEKNKLIHDMQILKKHYSMVSSTHVTAAMLTANARPNTGSCSGQYVRDPWGRQHFGCE